MTVTQTVDIPAGRRLTIDVPREVPVGWTILAFTPAPDQNADDRATPRTGALKRILSQPTPHADALLGAAANLTDISFKEIREERLAKHIK